MSFPFMLLQLLTIQSLLSVIVLPCMSGLVGAVLLQQTPGFIISETFLPTHLYVSLSVMFADVAVSYTYSSTYSRL
jgi:hypothetical protein